MSDVLSPTHKLTLHNDAGQPYTLQLWLNSPQAPTLLLLDGDWLQDCIQHFRKRHATALNIASLGYGTTHAETTIRRAYDFTPPHPDGSITDPRVKEWKNGGAPAFSDFLEKTLIPTLAQHIDLNSSKLGLFGHSYAGLYALHLWLQQRPLFDQYVVASPSVWWRWPYLQQLAATVTPTTQQTAPLHILLGEQEQWHAHPQQPGKKRPPGEPTLPLIQAWLHALPPPLQPHCQLELCPQMAHGPMLAHSATIALDLMRL